MKVPFNSPCVTGDEFRHIEQAIANLHLSGNGPFNERCAGWLRERCGSAAVLMAPSCTGALEMAAMLVGVKAGDEVIMPSFTHVSTANAFALRGAIPVFVDIRHDTLNLDERAVEGAITRQTKAIVPVHYAGVGCHMETLGELAEQHDLALIEDAAHGLDARYGDRRLGGIGALGAFSFHETKNVTCGEGGALLVNDPAYVEAAEIVQEKGTDRARFFRGEVDRYSWVGLGSSYLLSEINAAFLWAQLERAPEITAGRRRIWSTYHEALAELERSGRLRRPVVPDRCEHNAHLYYVLLPDRAARDALIAGLRERGVASVFHYVPLHSSPAGRRLGRAQGELVESQGASERLLRLPLWSGMSDRQVEHVITSVDEVLAGTP